MERFRFRFYGLTSLLALACALSPALAEDPAPEELAKPSDRWVPASAMGTRPVDVAPGQARLLKANSKIERFQVAPEGIVNLKTFDDHNFAIVGVKPGLAKVEVWTEGTGEPLSVNVKVAKPAKVTETTKTTEGTEIADTDLVPTEQVPGVNVPSLSVKTSTPEICEVGKSLDQHIVLTNVAKNPVENVVLRAQVSLDCRLVGTLPKALIQDSTMVWKFPKIEPGESRKITIRLLPVVAGQLECNTFVSFGSQTSSNVQVRKAELKLECDGPQEATSGEQVKLIATVSNTGNAPAKNVKVYQWKGKPIEDGQPYVKVGTLLPGESRIIESEAIAGRSGRMRVNLVAVGDSDLRADTGHSLVVRAPGLALETSGPRASVISTEETYHLTVSNPGDAATSNVNVIVRVPKGMDYVSASHGGFKAAGKPDVRWAIGLLQPGEVRRVHLKLSPRLAGSHLQRVVAWADRDLVASADLRTAVASVAKLDVAIIPGTEHPQLDETVQYTVRISNGSKKPAEKVQLGLGIPEGMLLESVGGPARYQVRGQHVVFDALPELGIGSEIVVQVRAKAIEPGQKTFRVELVSPTMAKPVVEEATLEVF